MTQLPFTSLDTVSSTGAGSSKDLEGVLRVHTLQVSVTGSPTFAVVLEGSHDAVNWEVLGVQVSQSTDLFATASTHLVRYVRANLTVLSGGTSPTVTATVASS